MSKSLKRSVESGLLHFANREKRVNRSGLMEFLSLGFKYVFPPLKGSLAHGVPTGVSAEPLKSRFLDDGDPPEVWPYLEGKVWGIAFAPLYSDAVATAAELRGAISAIDHTIPIELLSHSADA